MKKVMLVVFVVFVLSFCNFDFKFNVKGDVLGVDGKMFYLEVFGFEGIVFLDFIKLKGDGLFSFK